MPGVAGATRYKVEPAAVTIGGETTPIPGPGEPLYHVVYELDDPAVMDSEAWATAVEAGRWPGEVRPHTRNRRHVLMRKI